MSRGREIIESGDVRAMVSMSLNARAMSEDGVFCRCPVPDLEGEALMCRVCLLENTGQRERRAARQRAPHAFLPDSRAPFICTVCAWFEDDQRHAARGGTP